jgi:hypothetical protein
MRRLGLPIALLLAVPLAAQQASAPPEGPRRLVIPGRVLDATTGEPLAGAVVRLTDGDALAVTDSAGSFVLRAIPPGTHPWQISRLGYATWNEDVQVEPEDEEFTIRLLPRPRVLEGLVVVADRLGDRRATSGMTVELLEHSEIVRTAGSDLYIFLQSRLGVPLVPCGSSVQEVANRGRVHAPVPADPVHSGDEVEKNCAWVRNRRVEISVFIDEQRATDGLSQLRATPPADVHSIEVFSGGSMIRVYTEAFVQRAARDGLTLLPLPFSPGLPVPGGLNRGP